MKALVFLPGGIGDVLMATPFIRQLKKNLQDINLTCLTSVAASKVLDGNVYVNKIISFDYKHFFKRDFKKIYELWRKIFRKYDLIFMLNKHKLFNIFSFFLGIKKRIGFDRFGEGTFLTYKIPYYGRKHEIFYYLDLLKALNIEPNYEDHKMDIFLSEDDTYFAKKFFKKYELEKKKVITIAPGGAKNVAADDDIRRWPVENYIMLIKKIKRQNIKVILIGGKEDKSIEQKILKEVDCLSLIGKSNLKQSAAIMNLSDLVICNDSGPMHLAASVNKYIISIFGPTSPIEKAPLHKESISLWNPVGCNPCFDLWGRYPKNCPYNKKCLKSITPEIVFQAILKLLENKKLMN